MRGGVYPHFADEEAAEAGLLAAGFDRARLHRGDEHPAAAAGDDPGAALIHVIEASVG